MNDSGIARASSLTLELCRRVRSSALACAAAFAALVAAFTPGCGSDGAPAANALGGVPDRVAALCSGWTDHPANPLIAPPPLEPIIADPSFVRPEDAPDGRWHLFAHAVLSGIHHYTSNDGIAWSQAQPALFGAARIRPYVYLEDGTYYLFYEALTDFTHSHMELRTSSDLFEWSEPSTVIEPELEWERGVNFTTGNPFVMKRGDGYWLYYSADGVFLDDTLYFEPKYVGVARSQSIRGPYRKEPLPILGPSITDPELNLGAGSIKLLTAPVDGRWVAFNNTIYDDENGESRSSIRVLFSQDGLAWRRACDEPIVAPEPNTWKRTFVYAFDVKPVGDELWMYYNARAGRFSGSERIGLTIWPHTG